jgi:hypothetical protein
LRHVLAVGLVGLAGAWFYPRAQAAWRLNGLAVALADYGVCMAGPTGAALLRARQMDEFHTLVRRRLVTAPAGETPFARCAPFAQKITNKPEVERAHRASAFEFSEYGGNPKPGHTLGDLAVSPEVVAEEAHRAWPIIRGYSTLVKPSLGAREALHPVAPPEPARGRGLPNGRAHYRTVRTSSDGALLAFGVGANLGVYRSTDGGVTFTAAPRSAAVAFAERCPLAADGHALALRNDGNGTLVVSLVSGGEPTTARLASESEEIVAVACDDRVLVAATRPEGGRRASLRRCTFRGPCEPMPSPDLGRADLGLDYPLDLARVSGTTVVALTMGNLVRVVSARDGGGWTPPAVAYDGEVHPLPAARRPTRLLTLGRRLLLHGVGAKPSDTYGLLYSDDQGASFRGR